MFPLQMLFAALLGWLEREQRDVITFLREENRALKSQLTGRRLAVLGQRLGRGVLRRVATSRPIRFFDGIAN